MKCQSALIMFCVIALACNNEGEIPDASGTFEAVEVIVSAEVNGRIMEFNIEEGDSLVAGEPVGYIDSTQLHLNKLQLRQNRKAILTSRPEIDIQLQSMERELQAAITDRDRIANLVKGEVASQKQLDDANATIDVLQAKIAAQQSSLNVSSTSLNEQGNTVAVQMALIEDQLSKCRLVSPISGTVLMKYAEENEFATTGKPLYKIANLSDMILRAYVSGNQLPNVNLNQSVTVLTDDGDGGYHETTGTVTWISDRAEFTPKTIQTREERADKVYAIKVRVRNDGRYKIGMYGEIKF